jgi:tetratricopeptide (TPR) repeat protein
MEMYEFRTILQKLIDDQGKETFQNPVKFKAFLSDYTRGEYKKESRLLLTALEAGVQKAIDETEDIALCKKQQIKILREEHFLAEEIATDIVDTLIFVLRLDITVQTKSTDLFKSGIKFLDNNDWKNAIKQFDAAIKINPFYGDFYYRRAIAYLNISQYDATINDINMAVELDGNNCFYYFARGRAYAHKKNYDLAIKDLTDALNGGLANLGNIGYKARGKVFFENDQYDKAIIDYTEAINMEPDFETYNGRGNAYSKQEQHEEAIIDFTEAIKLDSTNANIYHSRGMAYFVLKKYDIAINDFNEVSKIIPNFAENYGMRGYAYRMLGKNELAIQDFKKALSLDPNLDWVKQGLKN